MVKKLFVFILSLYVMISCSQLPDGIPRETEALAKEGNSLAQYILGGMYIYGQEGVQQNTENGMFWLTKAADQGHREASNLLGSLYNSGDYFPRDLDKAVKFLTIAANQEDTSAQIQLAGIFYSEENLKNNEKSAYWMNRAAENGNKDAQYMLALSYKDGTLLPQSHEKSFYWLYQSAMRGHPNAQAMMGAYCALGIGTPMDIKQAYIWLSLAVAGGDQSVTNSRNSMANLLSQEELRDAQSEADVLYKKINNKVQN